MSLTLKNLKEVWRNEFLPSIREEIRKVTEPIEARITELNAKIENIHHDLDPLKASIGDLTKKLKEIETSQQFISSQYDAVVTKVQEVKKQNKDTDNWIQQADKYMDGLSKDNYNIGAKLDELEQYTRRDCLEITGIPIVLDDNPSQLVREMSEAIGVQLAENDISVAHRLPPTKKVKDRLIVKFTRREKRDEVYKKRRQLKSKRTKDLPTVARQPKSSVISQKAEIHINESLTPYRRRLFGRLLEYKRSHNYKYIWTTNGKLMLRESDSSSIQCFVSHEQFDEFLNQQADAQ